jgi:hypothetical protein
MAAAIPALMISGALISAVGAMSAAKAQSQAASYNASISEQNATVAMDQAAANVAIQQKQAKQAEGSLIAQTGASGVTMEGSPTDVLAMSVTNAALDEETIKYSGRLKALGFENQAVLDRVAAKTATQQGYLTAASSLLTGAGNAGHSYVLATRGYSQTIGPA